MIALHKVDIIKNCNFNPRHISYPINQIVCKMTFAAEPYIKIYYSLIYK